MKEKAMDDYIPGVPGRGGDPLRVKRLRARPRNWQRWPGGAEGATLHLTARMMVLPVIGMVPTVALLLYWSRTHAVYGGGAVAMAVLSAGAFGGACALARTLAAEDLNRRQDASRSSALLAAIVESSQDAIIGQAIDGTILTWNSGAQRMYGYSENEAVGLPASILAPPSADSEDVLLSRVAAGERIGNFETTRVRKDGTAVEVSLALSPVMGQPGEVVAISTVARDVSERKRLEAQLSHQALHDFLTGLPNRVLFGDRIERALANTQRSGRPLAVMLLDLDRFKDVNDTFGHANGDKLLISLAKRIASSVRPADTVARLGGDEFVILLEDTEPLAAAEAAKRIADTVSMPFTMEGRQKAIRPSIGLAFSEHGEETAEELIRNADIAMYLAKAHPKNPYVVFEPAMHAAAIDNLHLKGELERAVENEEFKLHYQPMVELETGRVTGVEALLRWSHPKRGTVAPVQFVPLAEETGLIVPIGWQVLEQACRQVRMWQKRFPGEAPLQVHVNLSMRQLESPDAVEEVARVLEVTGIDPATLVLEITESGLMRDPDQIINKLWELKGLGIPLAVDDFGTGYSSLSYLQRFPLDILKIDKSFVEGVCNGFEESAVAHAVIKLGAALHLEVVAEGVERLDQANKLQEMGCHFGQGHYFARALDVPAMELFLAHGSTLMGAGPGTGRIGAGRLARGTA